ncbi:DUF1674 domain-containing protein [Hoeflea sp. WL0058]|uniref:DUF1674 domain-containing protein n=1 Tax=Flavimaribacter sediminis TaxID=2865987 RepID=A0AAE2ZLE5_9HYPH|nr:DUF1674 domain-containing protein [Flavimaribacter sediminis]MBW8638381.1 DUF1674 domain-containing protein [Flavimaribacter sediminis]
MTVPEELENASEEGAKTADSQAVERVPEAKQSEKDLPPAAMRALQEAEERRRTSDNPPPQRELGGRGGKDPARFGDWEIKGRAVDF